MYNFQKKTSPNVQNCVGVYLIKYTISQIRTVYSYKSAFGKYQSFAVAQTRDVNIDDTLRVSIVHERYLQ